MPDTTITISRDHADMLAKAAQREARNMRSWNDTLGKGDPPEGRERAAREADELDKIAADVLSLGVLGGSKEPSYIDLLRFATDVALAGYGTVDESVVAVLIERADRLTNAAEIIERQSSR